MNLLRETTEGNNLQIFGMSMLQIDFWNIQIDRMEEGILTVRHAILGNV